jgi:SpoVK/Ycf46/Vps4 family AAA+-type ATPase
MTEELSEQSVGELFQSVLQHAKCIEIRIDYAKTLTSQKQKYVLKNALNKVTGAINTICDLLPSSDSVLKIKKELDKSDLVYVMVLTEQLMKIKPDDMEEIVDIIDKFLIDKYGQPEQMQSLREDAISGPRSC